MIKRIVKLTFAEDQTNAFLQIFEESKHKIIAFEGCRHLELFRATQTPNIFFTYSYWDHQEALDQYRQSELFGKTWKKTKALFADKPEGRPEAWSVEVIETLSKQQS